MEFNRFLLLPVGIILDIFLRLPIDSVLVCRKVCRNWRNLLLDSYFADMHLRRKFLRLGHNDHNINSSNSCGGGTAQVGLGHLFLLKSEKKSSPCSHLLHYGEYDEQNTYKILSRINHRPIKKRIMNGATYCTLVGSCNGLVCVSEPEGFGEMYNIADPVYISNPVTGESIDLPSIQISYKSIRRIYAGFGYLPSTNEYKVVRIYTKKDEHYSHIQVYTLGSGNGWRNRGEITAYSFFLRTGILANGALHWFVNKRREPNIGPFYVSAEMLLREQKIVAFDLADETFHLVPSPPCFQLKHYGFEVQVLGGWLSVVDTKKPAMSLDIWLLKKTKNKKPTTNSIEDTDDDQYYKSWSWCKEFTIELKSMEFFNYKPFGFTRSGEVLIWGTHSSGSYQMLYRYDPNTSNLEQLMLINYLDAIPHMNSFVSLEAIGEKCGKRKRGRKRPKSGQNVGEIAYF